MAANYGSKQENEAGDAVRGIGKNAIEAFNFWTTLNAKYDVTGESIIQPKMMVRAGIGKTDGAGERGGALVPEWNPEAL